MPRDLIHEDVLSTELERTNEARDRAVAKMMKLWEAKGTRRAAKATGLSLMAVTLAACGGSSSDSDTTPTEPDPIDALVANFSAILDPFTDFAGAVTGLNDLREEIESLDADGRAAFDEALDAAELGDGDAVLAQIDQALKAAGIVGADGELIETVVDLAVQREGLQGQVAELGAQVSALNVQIAALEEADADNQSEIADLTAARDALIVQQTALEDQAADLEAELAEAGVDIEALEQLVGDLQGQLALVQQALTEAQETIDGLEEEVEQAEEAIDALTAERDGLLDDVAEIGRAHV